MYQTFSGRTERLTERQYLHSIVHQQKLLYVIYKITVHSIFLLIFYSLKLELPYGTMCNTSTVLELVLVLVPYLLIVYYSIYFINWNTLYGNGTLEYGIFVPLPILFFPVGNRSWFNEVAGKCHVCSFPQNIATFIISVIDVSYVHMYRIWKIFPFDIFIKQY